MYPTEVVEIDGSKVRVHQVGYDSSSDELCNLTELVTISPAPRNHHNTRNVTVHSMSI